MGGGRMKDGIAGIGDKGAVLLKPGWHLSVSDGKAFVNRAYALAFADVAQQLESAMVGPMPWFLCRHEESRTWMVAKGGGVISKGLQA